MSRMNIEMEPDRVRRLVDVLRSAGAHPSGLGSYEAANDANRLADDIEAQLVSITNPHPHCEMCSGDVFWPDEVNALHRETGWPYPGCNGCNEFIDMVVNSYTFLLIRTHVKEAHDD